MPMKFGAREAHVAGTSATTPTEGSTSTMDVDRDGVMFTNCHSSATVYVRFVSGDPTSTDYDLRVGPGETVPVETRDPFKVISSNASTTLVVVPFRIARSQGSG